ncbi:MAG: cyclic nucleotide-binding protein [Acidobacteria bacterium]|nr:MAG: cyclic nucleotide-binding protein [Acidobacteriota bacterium]PIE89609.1 MAG: cyclic nucleotide-binding protein [Acidobacteriota bacterium]
MNKDFLKKTALFEDLTEDELVEIILIGQQKTFQKGQFIFSEDDPGNSLFLIVDGSVRISKIQAGGEEALAVLKANSYFGEMSLFRFEPRSAHAIAHEKTSLFEIQNTALLKLFDQNRDIGFKFLWSFCKTLSSRLRNTNEKFNLIMTLANFC